MCIVIFFVSPCKNSEQVWSFLQTYLGLLQEVPESFPLLP